MDIALTISNQPKRLYWLPAVIVPNCKDMPVQQQDMVKLLNMTVSVPLQVAMGVGNPSFWHYTAELRKASADALAHRIGTLLVEKVSTEVVPKLQYCWRS